MDIATTPPPTTTQTQQTAQSNTGLCTPILLIGTAFFGIRYFNTKPGSSCRVIAGTLATLGVASLIKRLKSNP